MLSLNGAQCVAANVTTSNGTTNINYDANNCGTLTATTTSGSGMITYNCNGVVTTVDGSSAACQADYMALSSVSSNAFMNCAMGTCPP